MLVDVRGVEEVIVLQICATDLLSTYTWMASVPRTENVPHSQHVEVWSISFANISDASNNIDLFPDENYTHHLSYYQTVTIHYLTV